MISSMSIPSRYAPVVERYRCPSCRWIMGSGIPSRASSTACAWRSWCGAKRRPTPASAARRRSSARTAGADHARPRVGPSMTQNRGPGGRLTRSVSHCPSWSRAQASTPSSLRRLPLPLRTRIEPRRGLRSVSVRSRAS
jgi:hypothetical protein